MVDGSVSVTSPRNLRETSIDAQFLVKNELSKDQHREWIRAGLGSIKPSMHSERAEKAFIEWRETM